MSRLMVIVRGSVYSCREDTWSLWPCRVGMWMCTALGGETVGEWLTLLVAI